MSKHYVTIQEQLLPITSEEELSTAHAALGAAFRAKQAIALELEEQIKQLQQEAERKTALQNKQIESYFTRIYNYANANKPTIVTSHAKSIVTPSGRIGWQKEKDRIELVADETEVIESLRKLLKENAQSFIVTTERLDLKELFKNYEQVEGIKGLTYKEGTDKFYLNVSTARFEVQPSSSSERFVARI